MSSNSHSKFSPSRLARIIACPGSVFLCREVPQRPSSSYAQEGTLLHSYMEMLLNDYPMTSHKSLPHDASIDHRNACADALSYMSQYLNGDEEYLMCIEAQVRMPMCEEVYGTADLILLTADALHVFDWKFGRGVPVYTTEEDGTPNRQLMAYLVGAYDYLQRGKVQIPEKHTAHIHVVQPRIDNYSSHKVTPQEQQAFIQQVERTVQLANGQNPPFNVTSHCRWCDAAAICRTRVSQAQIDVERAFAAVADIKENRADMAEVLAIFERKSDLETCLKQIQQYVLYELAKGSEVKGYKLVRGRSNRAWSAAVTFDTLVDVLEEREVVYDETSLVKTTLISPAQFEKLLPKKYRPDMEDLTVKPMGALTVAKESDKRPAVNLQSMEEIYEGVAEEEE